MRVAVVDLHGQVEFLGERDVGTERFALQFLADSPVRNRSMPVSPMATTWLRVGGGEAVYFGHGLVEGDVVPGACI